MAAKYGGDATIGLGGEAMDHLSGSKSRHNIFANVDHDKHYNDVNFVSNKKHPNVPKDIKTLAISELNLRKKLAKAELLIKLESRGPTFHRRKLPKDTVGIDPNTVNVKNLLLNEGEYSESDSDDDCDADDLSIKSNHTKRAHEIVNFALSTNAGNIVSLKDMSIKNTGFSMKNREAGPGGYSMRSKNKTSFYEDGLLDPDESKHYSSVVDHFVMDSDSEDDVNDEESFNSVTR